MKMEDVRWIRALTCSLFLLLSVTIVQSQGSNVNVALNKPASQRTNIDDGNTYPASNAVNGNTNEFSHTLQQSNQWWRVDLQGQYYIKSMRIFNRKDCCGDRLQQIYVLTSNDNTAPPQDPHPHPDTAPDWTIRYYIVGPVGDEVSITLYLTEPSRHVAVFSQHDEGVTLAEVEIYSYIGQDAPSPVQTNSPTSSSIYSVLLSARATDGNINTFDADSYFSSASTNPHWWRVELQQACDQCSVVVYPYLRLFTTIGEGDFSRLSGFRIFISNRQTPGIPNTDQSVWINCLYVSRSGDQRGPIRAQCSQDNTRWIAVYKDAVEALELAEVQVFQRAPTFSSGSSVAVTGTTTGCVEISWPAANRGSSYRWTCTDKDWSLPVSQLTVRNICGYSADTPVSCSVLAVGSGGVSSSIGGAGRTTCQAPTNVILSLEDGKSAVNGTDRRKITATIEAGVVPNCARIQQFRFELSNAQGTEVIQTKELVSPNQNRGSVQFTNLDAVTNYKVVVIAENDKGNQSLPVEESVRTGELKPDSPPDEFTFQPNASCVDMSWGSPVEPNGDIKLYRFGPEAIFNRSTGVIATAKPLGEPGKTTESTIQITIPQVIFANKDTDLRYYLVIVQEIKEEETSEGKRRKRELTTLRLPQVDQDSLYNYTEAEALNLTHYVTRQLENKMQNVAVTIGDRSSSSGYYNRPLEPGKGYKVHYSYTVELDGMYITTVVLNDKIYMTGIETDPTPSQLIALVVIPIVLIIVVAVVIVWLRRKKNNDKNLKLYENSSSTPLEMHGSSSQEAPTPIMSRAVVKPLLPPPTTKEGDMYENFTMPKTSRVRMADLESFIMRNSKLIAEQYKMLEQLPTGNMTAAGLEENKGKNRYRGIYPVDDYRVVLRDNIQGTDFINASYINGFEKPNKFIAAMAPNSQTMNDFWHMIWQENISVIVMVTKLIEDGKKKCEQYWPDLENKAGFKFGLISVITMSDEVWADYAIRTIQAIRVENGHRKIKKITQYNYLTWPDHGVPKDTAPFILFYHKVFTSHKVTKRSPPILVHCSAGVGRTGTFIGLDYLLQDGATTGSVDLFECVKQMRIRRPNMVQKEKQYILMHHALTEYTTTSSFITDSATMAQKLDNHDRSGSGKESLIATEFTVIKKRIEQTEIKFEDGKAPENRKKNRFKDILPADKYRPFLQNGDSDYVNAILVNSYRTLTHFVVTQLPLANTVTDFWALIHQRKCSTIIQLQTTDAPFLPPQNNRTAKYGLSSVNRKASQVEPNFTTIDLVLTFNNKPERKMKVFEVTSWDNNEAPKEALKEPRVMISLVNMVKKWQQQAGKGSVAVLCRYGSTRCGLYINISNALEKLEVETDVDVYNPVLMSCLRRPQFINSLEQYVYIYCVLRTYGDAFTEYSNFR